MQKQRDESQRWDSMWQKESISAALPTSPALPSATARRPGSWPAPSPAQGLPEGSSSCSSICRTSQPVHETTSQQVHEILQLEHGTEKCHSHICRSGLERSWLSSANSNLTSGCLSWRNCCLTLCETLVFPRNLLSLLFFPYLFSYSIFAKASYSHSFWY